VTVVLAVGIAALATILVRAGAVRHDVAGDVAFRAGPLVVDAADLHVTLADADFTASTAFLDAGLEDYELRARYLEDIRRAGQLVTTIARGRDLSESARTALTAVSAELPRYAGLVETARTNNRLGFPLGATYLRDASRRMRSEILPNALTIYEDNARRLGDRYWSGTSPDGLGAGVGVGVALIAALVIAQLILARRTRRIVNPPVLVGTVVVAMLATWAVVAFSDQQRALLRSRQEGFDQLVVLSNARIMALQSFSLEKLDLIERGTEKVYQDEFDTTIARVGGADGKVGLLGTATQLAMRTSSQQAIGRIAERYREFLAIHTKLRGLEDGAKHAAAVGLAVTRGTEAAQALDDALHGEIAAAQYRLTENAREAHRAHQALWIVVVVMAASAVALVILGLHRRIREYG
jgi:hypothetical protein